MERFEDTDFYLADLSSKTAKSLETPECNDRILEMFQGDWED